MDVDPLADLEATSDPVERARAATELLTRHQSLVARLARIRRQAIAELRARGMSYAQVGEALGLTRGRIAQLRAEPHPIEREFFGGAPVTILTPLRASPEAVRPVIAHEDFEAAAALSRFLEGADIQILLAHASPGGKIQFPPGALVAICGPKSSPVVRQVLAVDPMLDFAADESGRWRILDRSAGRPLVSPADDNPDATEDYAYVGRLRRPDSTASFLLVAGIHAIGSLGAVHYLTQPSNLYALHRAVGTQEFSMAVSCKFTRSPLRIVESAVALPPRVHRP